MYWHTFTFNCELLTPSKMADLSAAKTEPVLENLMQAPGCLQKTQKAAKQSFTIHFPKLIISKAHYLNLKGESVGKKIIPYCPSSDQNTYYNISLVWKNKKQKISISYIYIPFPVLFNDLSIMKMMDEELASSLGGDEFLGQSLSLSIIPNVYLLCPIWFSP